jgi:hypothetical protein
LLHPAGRGRGKRLLYWFRTPPGVRVGRAPIDETAIRLLEQHNPDVQFDWTRILKAPPPAEGQGRRDPREGRDKDQRGRREPRSSPRPRSGGAQAAPAPARQSRAAEHAEQHDRAAEHAEHAEQHDRAAEHPEHGEQHDRAAEHAEQQDHAAEHAVADPEQADLQAAAVGSQEYTELARIAESEDAEASPAEIEPSQGFEIQPRDVGSASYVRLGAEGLVRLRARYAEVMARITDHPLDEEAREELKQRAERLNPDAWVTADEVTAALEQYETVFEGLRGIVGRHPQRRRRGRKQV